MVIDHTKKSSPIAPPPSNFLRVVEHARTIYKAWIMIRRAMPRVERFAIGTRIDSLYLDLLELLRRATFAEPKNKIVLLEDSNIIIDSLRFFYQLAWEAKLVKDEQYTELAVMIEEVGRQIGAWKLGMIAKTSPRGEERF